VATGKQAQNYLNLYFNYIYNFLNSAPLSYKSDSVITRVICVFTSLITEGFTDLRMAKIACPKCNSKKLYKLESS
jgi:hypothetical protein